MDISSIGAASIQMSLANTQQAVGVSVLKKAMDQETQAADLITKMTPPPPHHMLDLRV